MIKAEIAMPTINVTERTVHPRLDQGLLAGLIAGGISYVWLLLVGLLSGGAAGTFTNLAALAIGPGAFDTTGRHGDWLVGTVIYFGIFSLLGIAFALAWPKLRRYGTWTPSILFSLAVYLLVFQIIGRISQPALAAHLNDFALIIGFIIAGFTLAYRYRKS